MLGLYSNDTLSCNDKILKYSKHVHVELTRYLEHKVGDDTNSLFIHI